MQKNDKKNPLYQLGVKSIDEVETDLTPADKLDFLLNTKEGKELIAKKNTLSQDDFQVKLLAIKEQYIEEIS